MPSFDDDDLTVEALAQPSGAGIERQQPHAYIHTVPDGEAEGETRRWYDRSRNADGSLDNIASIHGLSPETGHAHWSLYLQAMKGESPLSLAEREMIGVSAAVVNGCPY